MTRPVRVLLALVVLFAAAVVAIDRLAPTPGGPEGSSYATAPAGAAAYAELLRRAGHPVRRVRTPLAERPLDPRSTLVVLDPERIEPEEARAIRRFVDAGGRLVAGGALVRWLGRVLPSAPAWAAAPPGRAAVVAPVPETAGIDAVAFDEGGRWAELGGALPVLATPSGPVAAVARLGRGRVILLADSAPLLNGGLPRADSAAFALAVAGEAARPVAFLETVHGYGEETGLAALPDRALWVLGGLALAALALVWSMARRLGPPEDEERAVAPPRRGLRRGGGVRPGRVRRPARGGRRGGARRAEAARGARRAPGRRRRARAARGGGAPRARHGRDRGRARRARRRRPGSRPRARAARGGTAVTDERGRMQELHRRVAGEVEKVVVGQGEALEVLLGALSLGGHVLLEGPPGVAKTLLANATARALGLEFRRVQFTPDMLPSDVTGTMALRGGELRFRPGPVFANLVLADEINRTPPKTQAALLEAMQEGQVTVDGEPHPLPDPFLVVATQNPVEYEGTYPLPEAQRDRFLVRVDMGYPSEESERALLRLARRGLAPSGLDAIAPVADAAELRAARDTVDATDVAPEVLDYLVAVVRRTRELPSVELGASPRAAVHLLGAAKAAARLAGRDFVTPDDVARMALPVLRHRLVLTPEAELERYTPESAVRGALDAVPVPR